MAEAAKAAAQTEESILYKEGSAFAVITLNRPDKLNSFNEIMHKALRSALDRAIANKKVRALILTGAGRGFCAGQDLSDRLANAGPFDLADTLGDFYNPLVAQLRTLPFPLIAAINGVAAGAGATLALNADIIIAARSAKFIQSFSKIGLIPDSGGTWSLPRMLGRGKAFGLTALSETISAEEAEKFGMIYKVVDDASLMSSAEEIAVKLSGLATHALVKLRELFDASEGNSLIEQLELERVTQSALGKSADYAEGVKSFFEKRSPKYSERN